MIAQLCRLNHIQVGQIVKEKSLHFGKDQVYDSFIIDEDAVVDELDPIMEKGGNIVDHHGCDFFPESWFDLILCLTTDNSILYKRLEDRGYSDVKIQENVSCEIMQVVLQEAVESYEQDKVILLQSNTVQDMEENIQRVEEWIENWINKEN